MKKAYLATVSLTVRVVIPDHLDPDMDPEFDIAVAKKIETKLYEEGLSAISENITDWEEDEELPYNPEIDI
jgi:hypothetical protein